MNKKRNKDFLYVKRTIQGCANLFHLRNAENLIELYRTKSIFLSCDKRRKKIEDEEISALQEYLKEQERKIFQICIHEYVYDL